jgi:hypothetical protein
VVEVVGQQEQFPGHDVPGSLASTANDEETRAFNRPITLAPPLLSSFRKCRWSFVPYIEA